MATYDIYGSSQGTSFPSSSGLACMRGGEQSGAVLIFPVIELRALILFFCFFFLPVFSVYLLLVYILIFHRFALPLTGHS